jgi:hypothetical protein
VKSIFLLIKLNVLSLVKFSRNGRSVSKTNTMVPALTVIPVALVMAQVEVTPDAAPSSGSTNVFFTLMLLRIKYAACGKPAGGLLSTSSM